MVTPAWDGFWPPVFSFTYETGADPERCCFLKYVCLQDIYKMLKFSRLDVELLPFGRKLGMNNGGSGEEGEGVMYYVTNGSTYPRTFNTPYALHACSFCTVG